MAIDTDKDKIRLFDALERIREAASAYTEASSPSAPHTGELDALEQRVDSLIAQLERLMPTTTPREDDHG